MTMSARPCAQFIVGRHATSPSVNGPLACCLRCVVVKSVGPRTGGPAPTGSWQPSSETEKFEHREPARRAKGAVKDDPGCRGERPHRGLIDADHHECGQDHEHIGSTEASRGSDGHPTSLRFDRATRRPDIGLRHRRDLDATGVSVIAVAGLARRPQSCPAPIALDTRSSLSLGFPQIDPVVLRTAGPSGPMSVVKEPTGSPARFCLWPTRSGQLRSVRHRVWVTCEMRCRTQSRAPWNRVGPRAAPRSPRQPTGADRCRLYLHDPRFSLGSSAVPQQTALR